MNFSAALIDKMRSEGIPEAAIETFAHFYLRQVQGVPATIAEAEIIPVDPGSVPNMSDLDRYAGSGRAALAKTAIIKLNGGLGTTMGLDGPKSLIRAKNDLSFLDITVRQVGHLNEALGTSMHLLLMNSFFTELATQEALHGMGNSYRDFVDCFSQHKYPKVDAETLGPASWPEDPDREWNPAGHGDLFLSLESSGLLQMLIERGYRYLFVSNIDNLGAQINLPILGYFADEGIDFLMEVTDRTSMDRKGGHLARLKNGRLTLREAGQCAPEDLSSFRDVARHSFFNTNNVWISLDAIKQWLEKKQYLLMPPVITRKPLNVHDATSPAVLNFESALGSAISLFERSVALRVPRTRFAPVKNCDDLLLIWSDYYILSQDYQLRINPSRQLPPISIALDPAYYSLIDLLHARFPVGAPSLVDCESFSVNGDIKFGRRVIVQGTASLSNTRPVQAIIGDGTVVSGNRTV